MNVELGVTAAYNLFAQKDFAIHDAAIKEAQESNADEKKYFLDKENGKLWMGLYSESELIKSVVFKSTKAKIKKAIKFYM